MRTRQGSLFGAIRVGVGIAAATTVFFAGTAIAAAPVIQNGGFESGDFTGWKVNHNDRFDWQVYSATSNPDLPAPARGTYAATVDEGGPSTPILRQSFTVHKHAKLKMFSGYSAGAPIAAPHELNAAFDDRHHKANEQYRIDVMRAGSKVKSLAKKDVLLNVFRTKKGDRRESDVQKLTADLSSLAGKKVYLRFAVPNNQDSFDVVIDGIKVRRTK